MDYFKDRYLMSIAVLTAKNSTCSRLSTGAVIVSKEGKIISTGYNGAPSGLKHCINVNKEKITPCRCVHAEQNAVVYCLEPWRTWKKIYVTDTPCYSCMKLVLAFGIKEIYYYRRYRDDEKSFNLAKEAEVPLIHIPELIKI